MDLVVEHVEAARDLPVDLLLAIGPGADPASLGPVPRNVRVATYVPQRAVLDRCAATICHGGYGSLLDAIDAAVPLVVVPFGADQYVNADSLVRLGIGSSVDEDALDAATVRHAIIDLLSDHGARDRITAIRDAWHGAPGPAVSRRVDIASNRVLSNDESSGFAPSQRRSPREGDSMSVLVRIPTPLRTVTKGAAEVKLGDGDVEWWDLHNWENECASVPADAQ